MTTPVSSPARYPAGNRYPAVDVYPADGAALDPVPTIDFAAFNKQVEEVTDGAISAGTMGADRTW